MLANKDDSNYLYRLTVLFGIAELSQVMAADGISKNFLPVLNALAADKIPNIRLNVAKTIWGMRKHRRGNTALDNAIEAELLQILNMLKNDVDDDVKFYTKKAIVMM